MKVGYSARLRRFSAAVEQIKTKQIFLEAAKEQQELALDLNRFQLIGGIDGDGKSLGEYSKSNRKKSGRRDLYDTGDFQGAMYLDTKQIPIFIESKDKKTPILKAVHGAAILKLTKENEKDFGNEVKKIYTTKVHEAIEVLAEKILY